jgi:cyclopropane-fatty-acyl-phospholipid synthase
VHSVTLSVEQRELALERVREAGLEHLVTIDICDYRDVQGTFDAVVSVEMIEAVGYQYWPEYFATLDRHLKPGGKVGLQAITMPHDRMVASRDTFTWIHKYIFPGGLIPSVASIEQSVFAHTSLRITDRFAFGQHYAETLRLWRERFEADADEVAGLGFDDTFRKMWSLYLAYSEAGFASGYLDVYQFVFEKGR